MAYSRKPLIMFLTLLSTVLLSGCVSPEQAIKTINERIQDRFTYFSSVKSSFTAYAYYDGELVIEQEWTDVFKKPDKIKQVRVYVDYAYPSSFPHYRDESSYFCKGNSEYRLGEGAINNGVQQLVATVNTYTALPRGVGTYCGYMLDHWNFEVFQIPRSLANELLYDVNISEVIYNGSPAYKAVIIRKMSELEKQKQIDIGNEPSEEIHTYWFNASDLSILKEEFIVTNQYKWYSPNQSTIFVKEQRVDYVYHEFSFDTEIPDSEFDADLSGYNVSSEVISLAVCYLDVEGVIQCNVQAPVSSGEQTTTTQSS